MSEGRMSERWTAIDVVAEFLHDGGPPLAADDAAVAIIDALEAAGLAVVASMPVPREEDVEQLVYKACMKALLAAGRDLRWNAADGSDPDTDVIVESSSWVRFRRALVRALASDSEGER